MKKVHLTKNNWRKLCRIRTDQNFTTLSQSVDYLFDHQSVSKEENQHILDDENLFQNLDVDKQIQTRIQKIKTDHSFGSFSSLLNHLLDCHTILQRESLHKPQELNYNEEPLQTLEKTTILDEIYNHIQQLKLPQKHDNINDISPINDTSPEKQAFLLDDLSKQYENPTGQDHKSESFKNQKDNMSSGFEDVNEKTANKVNVSDGKSEWICCPVCWNIVPLNVELDPDGNPLNKPEAGVKFKDINGVLQRRFSGPSDAYLPFQIRYGNNINIEESMAISILRRLDQRLFADFTKLLESTFHKFTGMPLRGSW